jgi:O-antigen ligase
MDAITHNPGVPVPLRRRRRRRGLTAARVLPVFLLAFALLYALVFTPPWAIMAKPESILDPTLNEAASSTNIANELFWGALFGASVLAALLRRTATLGYSILLWPLALYLAWAAATIPWAADHDIVVRRLVLQFCIIGSILLPVAMIDEPIVVHRVLIWVAFLTVLINAVGLPLIKPTSLGYAGIYSQKNVLGEAAALAFIVFVTGVDLPDKGSRLLAWLGLPLAVLLLVVSRSKTSLILCFLAPVMALAVTGISRLGKIRPSTLMIGTAVLSAAVILVAFGAGIRFDRVLGLVFGDSTFTGRTDIWHFAWSEFRTRPLTGFGFNGFWGTGANAAASFTGNDFLSSILEAHDGYLDVLLETGVVGLSIVVCLALVTLKLFDHALGDHSSRAVLFLALVFFFLIHNAVESSIFRRYENAWVFFLVAAFSVTQWRLDGLAPHIFSRRRLFVRTAPFAVHT